MQPAEDERQVRSVFRSCRHRFLDLERHEATHLPTGRFVCQECGVFLTLAEVMSAPSL